MTYKHYEWPDINNYHNMLLNVKTSKCDLYFSSQENDSIDVFYNAKIKLHGSNAAIVITNEEIYCQSRSMILKGGHDLKGFVEFVDSVSEQLRSRLTITNKNVILHGEWCGKGIQKGVAISNISEKIFVIFAVSIVYADCPDNVLMFITDPKLITKLVGNDIPNIYVLPWFFKNNVSIPIRTFSENAVERLTQISEKMNNIVSEIDKEDPWVLDVFDVKGAGEGLVFYPQLHASYNSFNPRWFYSNFAFKVKGEKHKTVSKMKSMATSVENFSNIEAFATAIVAPARLEQGAQEVNKDLGYCYNNIPKFIEWICKDVNKECQAELEANNFNKKTVMKCCANVARKWYLNQITNEVIAKVK